MRLSETLWLPCELPVPAMSNLKSQAIAGVSAGTETQLMTKWPSISALGLGRVVGQVLEMFPIRFLGLKVSNLLFGLPMAGPAVGLYFAQKIVGERYTITTKSVQRWTGLGGRMIQRIELGDIASMQVQQQPGQEFFQASDVLLLNEKGDVIMRLEGLPHADIFRQNISKAKESVLSVQASLKTIQARH